MAPIVTPSRPSDLRRSGKLVGRLALAVQFGLLLLGLSLFLDHSKDLLSDAQFTWGERRIMAIVAVATLGGCGLAGWILGQLLRLLAGVIDVLAEGAESASRTNELIEQHLVPTLGRIARHLEESSSKGGQARTPPSPASGPKSLQSELAEAQATGRVSRTMDLRDALTQHLRGESLDALDRGLAIWLLNLVERRVQARTVDAEVATWVARALDSFGDLREAEPLRQALPALRRQAGLCIRCGRPLSTATRSGVALCPSCHAGRAVPSGTLESSSGSSSARE